MASGAKIMAKLLDRMTVMLAKEGLVLRRGEEHEEAMVNGLSALIYEHYKDLHAEEDEEDDSSYVPGNSEADEGEPMSDSDECEPSGESLDSDE